MDSALIWCEAVSEDTNTAVSDTDTADTDIDHSVVTVDTSQEIPEE